MPMNAGHLLLVGGGGVFVWSGIRGKSVSSVFRQLAGGDTPTGATNANQITGVSPISSDATIGVNGATTASDVNPGDISSGTATANEMTIAEFLVRNGYSEAAAAGIVGCIAGESNANPESKDPSGADGGIIGWTPLGSAHPVQPIITGNASKDLQSQLTDLLTYNQIWHQYIAGLNAQTDPVKAADYYSQNFERPAVTDSDVRAGVATAVYNNLKNGGASNVPTG